MTPDFETTWRRRFEEFGRDYDDDAAIAGWSETGLQARFRNFARSWRPDGVGDVWLDAGCGAGTYARLMAASGQHVIALDYSMPSLIKARRRSGEGPSISWVVGDVTRLPLGPRSCDGAICFGVLQALGSPTRAISELARVVRPGGQVWVDALNASSLPKLAGHILAKARREEERLRYDSPRRLTQAFREAGFGDISLMWVPILPGRVKGMQDAFQSAIARTLFARLPWLGSAVSHAYVLSARR